MLLRSLLSSSSIASSPPLALRIRCCRQFSPPWCAVSWRGCSRRPVSALLLLRSISGRAANGLFNGELVLVLSSQANSRPTSLFNQVDVVEGVGCLCAYVIAVARSARVALLGVAVIARPIPNGCRASISAGTGLATISALECGSIIPLLGISGNAPISRLGL